MIFQTSRWQRRRHQAAQQHDKTTLREARKKNFKIQDSGFKLIPVKEIPRTYSGKIDYARLK